MREYLDLLLDIRTNGVKKGDRTGAGTLSVFGRQLRFDLARGFPLVTTKKLHLRSIIHELLWFLSGDTNTRYLTEHGVSIWNEWADEKGDLGPVYGYQWRSWPAPNGESIDQIARVVEQIRTRPTSRRLLVTALNIADFPDESRSPQENVAEGKMALAPCHALFQLHVSEGRLSCLFWMRSVDTFLGLPFNIASYAFLTHMLAQQCDLEPGDLVWMGGDVHLYLNHLEQVDLQLAREPYALPTLHLSRRPPSIFEYRYEDFEIRGYQSHPSIKAPIAV